MKKLIALLIMVILVVTVASDSETKNKGSSQELNASNINALTPDNIDLTAETANLVVQQNLSNNDALPGLGVVVMNNLKNLTGYTGEQTRRFDFMVMTNSLPRAYGITRGTIVLKIWPTYLISMTTNTKDASSLNGANGCNVKKDNFYNFFHSAGYSTAV